MKGDIQSLQDVGNKADEKQNNQISALIKGGQAQKQSLKQLDDNLKDLKILEKSDFIKVVDDVASLKMAKTKVDGGVIQKSEKD